MDPWTSRLAGASPERPVRVGRYDVVGELGEGGMGKVYDAVDAELGAHVALKTLHHLDAASLARFKTEFRAVADLSHGGLVELYELGEHDGLWFLTMEKVDGTDFLAYVREASGEPDWNGMPSLPPSLGRVREAFAQLARAVHALHAAGLLHLDLKPSNVLVDRTGRVVVLDFGLVRGIDDPPPPLEGDAVTISGTPAWMAPEQFAGVDIGEAADWYAVGLMLYAALTGVTAFPTTSAVVTRHARQFIPVTAPTELLRGVPADLSAITVALLEPEPADRPNGETLMALLAGTTTAKRALAKDRDFVGREAARARLEAAFAQVAAGGGAVVRLTGPSGAGKSALLRRAVASFAERGALVLRGRCYERETVPYKAFDTIVDQVAMRLAVRPETELAGLVPQWIAELARVFPGLASVPIVAARLASCEKAVAALPMVELRRRAVAALRELFARLAQQAPLVLAIDDLQWADADSEALVRGLADVSHVMLAVTSRESELADVPELVAIDVGPLATDEAEQLARATLGEGADPALAAAIAREAGGVPFFIEELARYAGGGGDISLADAIRARVAALPADQRALVEIVAVADVPVAQSLVFAAAGLPAGALGALLALRSASLLGWSGAGVDDVVSIYHDRIREAVLAAMPDEVRVARHLALGRAVVARHAAPGLGGDGAWLYQAVRHLTEGRADDRAAVARLAARAGRLARQTAAFPLAFASFERGLALLGDDAWDREYALALELCGGAAEAAYLCAAWDAMARRCAEVVARGRSPLAKLVAWETQIDAAIGRHAYGEALAAGRAALAELGVALPEALTGAEIVAAVDRALAALEAIGVDGLRALGDVADPAMLAAMRVQVRLAPAAYFGAQTLVPAMACNLIEASIARGLSTATPYALALFGLVLNTLGRHAEAHRWGWLAVELVDRWPDDRKLEAATRQVAYNLVLPWVEPLPGLLAPLRAVWDIGRRTGDLEYASYAAHAYVHDALYCGRPVAPLLDEALQLGAGMRALGQVNAVHVHAPFEQLLKRLCGRIAGPGLDEPGVYDEAAELAAAARAGSRSGVFVVRLAMGLARYWSGALADAYACFEAARADRDAVPSVWHQPIWLQFHALAACALADGRPDREALRAQAAADLAELRALAAIGPANFEHRVALVASELARLAGDGARATALREAARAAARAGDWAMDVALVQRLAGEPEHAWAADG